MGKIQIGKRVPDFTLKETDGTPIKLSQFLGQKVVLYFYPRDNTPGCTAEACDFRDNYRKFTRRGVVIIGISPDSEKSHQKFRTEHKLPYLLLSDPQRKVAKLFGVLKPKNMYGKSVLGIERSTFILDERGRLIAELRKVSVEGHVAELLKILSEQ